MQALKWVVWQTMNVRRTIHASQAAASNLVCPRSAATRFKRAKHCGPSGAPCGPCQVPDTACAGMDCGTDPTYGVECGDSSSHTDEICIDNHWVPAPNDGLRTLGLPFRKKPFEYPPVLVKYPPVSFPDVNINFGVGAIPGKLRGHGPGGGSLFDADSRATGPRRSRSVARAQLFEQQGQWAISVSALAYRA